MSASSLCVTCGIWTQLRCSAGPADALDARQGDALDLAELLEVELRPGRELQAAERRAGARRRRLRRLRRRGRGRLDVGLQDAALAAAALDRRELDAELAREPTHAGAGVEDAVGAPARAAPARRRRPAISSASTGRLLRRGGRGEGLARPSPDPAPRTATRGGSRCPRRPRHRPTTFTSCTTPSTGEGTSIVALSDSSVTSGSSGATVSPGGDVDLDDRDVVEVPDVGDLDLGHVGRDVRHGTEPGRSVVDLVAARSPPGPARASPCPPPRAPSARRPRRSGGRPRRSAAACAGSRCGRSRPSRARGTRRSTNGRMPSANARM